LYLFMLIFRSY